MKKATFKRASWLLLLVLTIVVIAPMVIHAKAAGTCRVTYSPMNGQMPWTTTLTQGGKYGALPTVSRSGYTFKGWYAGSTKVSSTSTVPNSATQTLTAKWAKQYTVTYNANGGSGGPSTQTKIEGDVMYITTSKPSRTGYVFNGWSTQRNYPVDYKPGAAFTVNANTTLYASWSIINYSISYNANGGSGAPSTQTKPYGVNVPLSYTKPIRNGYTFLGWSTSSTATTASYTAGQSFTNNSNTTLYAVWKPVTYTVSFNANGGSGGPGSQTKTYGVNLTLSSTKPSRTGYTFLGWSPSSSATTAAYTAGGSYTPNAGMTLYAVWKKNTYTVSYNANGGSGAPGSQTKTYGVTLTLSTTKPTRNGYTFLGWSTSSTATTASYTAGQSFTNNSNTTLYAVWKPVTYTVSFNANGGSGAPGSQTKTYGVNLTLSSTKPSRTGYTFLGWSPSSSATTAAYTAGGSYTPNAGMTLYAVWKKNTYTVSYNANGGSGAPGSQTKTYGVTLTLSSTKPTRSGYTFLGWGTSAGATTVAYAAGASYTANSGTTLYAIWRQNSFTISYSANGGNGAPDPQTKSYGVNLTLSSTKPTRANYKFLGWNTSSNATTALYSAGATYTANSDAKLYAVWQPDSTKYTVTLDFNGGTFNPTTPSKRTSIEVFNNGKYTGLDDVIAYKSGYYFDGWYTGKDGGSRVRSADVFIGSSNQTLYAHYHLSSDWKPADNYSSYSYSFKKNEMDAMYNYSGVTGKLFNPKYNGKYVLTVSKGDDARNYIVMKCEKGQGLYTRTTVPLKTYYNTSSQYYLLNDTNKYDYYILRDGDTFGGNPFTTNGCTSVTITMSVLQETAYSANRTKVLDTQQSHVVTGSFWEDEDQEVFMQDNYMCAKDINAMKMAYLMKYGDPDQTFYYAMTCALADLSGDLGLDSTSSKAVNNQFRLACDILVDQGYDVNSLKLSQVCGYEIENLFMLALGKVKDEVIKAVGMPGLGTAVSVVEFAYKSIKIGYDIYKYHVEKTTMKSAIDAMLSVADTNRDGYADIGVHFTNYTKSKPLPNYDFCVGYSSGKFEAWNKPISYTVQAGAADYNRRGFFTSGLGATNVTQENALIVVKADKSTYIKGRLLQ